MYVENDSVPKTFEIVSAVTKYAFELAGHLNVNVSKYSAACRWHAETVTRYVGLV